MDYSVRCGERAALVATLLQFAADRGERGESERATEARRAAQLLESGAEAAHFERIIYAVGESDRYSVVSDSREGVVRELGDAVDGWIHQGRTDLSVQAAQERARVKRGVVDVARVGHLLYVVRE